MVPRVLTIAGSDSGGGAGIQADLKAFAAAGAHGLSAIVALTAQNTVGVTAVHELPPEFVIAQLEAVFSDIGVDAVKTGMLFSRRLIETVADFLDEHPTPLVVDPVMIASSGARLLRQDAVETLVDRLFSLAAVVTPNVPEAEALTGGRGSQRELAERLHALGATAVVVTAGHAQEPVDWLFDSGFSHSAMSESEARMLGVPIHSAIGSAGDFAGGTAPMRTALVARMTIGDAELRVWFGDVRSARRR